jgi:hypothetical protein
MQNSGELGELVATCILQELDETLDFNITSSITGYTLPTLNTEEFMGSRAGT